MKDHKKMPFTQILIKIEIEVVKPHLKVNTETHMVDIINMKVKLMEVDEETLEEEEVIKVVVEVIKIKNQTMIQMLLL
jgi:hypothetical protein